MIFLLNVCTYGLVLSFSHMSYDMDQLRNTDCLMGVDDLICTAITLFIHYKRVYVTLSVDMV